MEQYNPDGKVAQLGVAGAVVLPALRQGGHRVRLRAHRATACSRRRAPQTDWTGGGLHAPQTPGNDEPSACFLIIGLDDDGFVYDEEATAADDGRLQLRPGERR